MGNIDFISEQGWFTMKIPNNWYEDEYEEGTYAFFDTTKWTGNFRVTPIKIENNGNKNYIEMYLEDEFEKKTKI